MSAQAFMMKVVSYRNSTSNHNSDAVSMSGVSVVSYRNSTSNHNNTAKWEVVGLLYLIEILHQTTTMQYSYTSSIGCILSKFYIKPQLAERSGVPVDSCILSKFYIKPQLLLTHSALQLVVSYRNSTSNHNLCRRPVGVLRLYLIEILHQTTTLAVNNPFTHGCILSKFYIKPQRLFSPAAPPPCCILSKFYIKPQPATPDDGMCFKLYLIEILHQTTTYGRQRVPQKCCILSKFYIKPQLRRQRSDFCCVVSYRNSTSNHNRYLR